MKQAQLIVDLDDYGSDFVERVRVHLQRAASNRWPSCRIVITTLDGTKKQ